jgi:CubicO group peptidase (beta-lactamase class C family)
VRATPAVLLAAAGLALPAPAHAAATAPSRDVRLQGVANTLVYDVFVGAGLDGATQSFFVPGTALTVSPAAGPERTFVAGASDLGRGTEVQASQIQPIGSGTKPFTAALVIELVLGRRLALSDTVAEIAAAHRRDGGRLQAVARRHAGRLRGVTLESLLNMTSGLQDYDDDPSYVEAFARAPRAVRSPATLIAYGLARPPLFAPGARGRTYYSNTNYLLLGMIVEAVTGESYARRLDALFARAGMRSSSYPGGASLSGLGRRLVRGYAAPIQVGQTAGAASRRRARPHPPNLLALYARAFARAPVNRQREAPAGVRIVSSNPLAEGPTVGVRPATDQERIRYSVAIEVVREDLTNAYSLAGATGAAGGAVSSTQDLARFWRALFSGRLLGREGLELMKRSTPAPPNASGVRNDFALGLARQDVAPGAFWPGSPRLRIWMKLGDVWGWTSAAYYVEGPAPYGGLVVTNTTNLFPSPVGDLGVLRDVLLALP